MIGTVLLTAYFIIDGIFVGKYLGAQSLAAMGLVMPFIVMSFALSDMIAVGCSVQIAMKLGRGKAKEASMLFSTALILIFGIAIIMALLLYVLTPFILARLELPASVQHSAKEFMQIFTLFLPFISFYYIFDSALRICGKTFYSMAMNVIIAVLNIFLDYLFIVVFGWGLFAAALATCVGFSIAVLFGVAPFVFQNLSLSFAKPLFKAKSLIDIFYNGSSEFFSNISASLYASFANLILLKLGGTNAVAAFSIITYIDNFIVMLLMSLGEGMQPALSYLYAKRDKQRLFALLKAILSAAFVLALLVFAVCMLFTSELTSAFIQKHDESLLTLAVFALSLYALHYCFAWFNICTNSILTAFNKAKFSLILSLAQTLFVPVILLYILSHFLGLKGVFLTAFFAKMLCAFLAVFFLKKSVNI